MPPAVAAPPRPGSDRFGIVAVIAATSCWGLGGVLGKSVGVGGIVISFWRLWIGAAFLNLVLVLSGRRLSLDVLRRSLLGGVFFGLNVAVYFVSVRSTSIADVAMISALTPVLIFPIAVRWMGERVTRAAVFCSLVAIAGVIVVVVGGAGSGDRSTSGDLFAVANLAIWVAFFITTKKTREGVGTLHYMAAMTIVAAVTVTPIALISARHDLGSIHGIGWLWLVSLVLVPGAMGHGLMAWAHPHVDVSVSSVLNLGEPILATITAAIFLGEDVSLVQSLAIAAVIAALAVLALRAPAGAGPEPVAPSG